MYYFIFADFDWLIINNYNGHVSVIMYSWLDKNDDF